MAGAVKKAAQQAETAPATREKTRRELVSEAVQRMSQPLQQALPRHVDHERFERQVLTAVKGTPELLECFGSAEGRTSLLLSVMQCAALGLEPNTPTQDAWILPRRNKGQQEAQLSIGYRGLLRLARRSGDLKTVVAEVVYAADEFRWARGLESDEFLHRPSDDADRGELTHAYAIARFLNGGYQFVVLNRADVEKRRAQSDSWRSESARKYSPWAQWPEAMWRKSALRELTKFLDLSPELAAAVHVDERLVTVDADGPVALAEFGPLEVDPDDDPPDDDPTRPFDDDAGDES